MTTAELLTLQYGRGGELKKLPAPAAKTPVHPCGPHKAAWYGLLVPVTAPRR